MIPQLFNEVPSISAHELEKYGIYKVPQIVYQAMFDSVAHYNRFELNQHRIRKVLLGYLEERYPDKVLESFEELTNLDASKLAERIPGITFGFYCKLLEKKELLITDHNVTTGLEHL